MLAVTMGAALAESSNSSHIPTGYKLTLWQNNMKLRGGAYAGKGGLVSGPFATSMCDVGPLIQLG